MKQFYLSILAIVFGVGFTQGQTLCSISITPTDTNVCPGSQVNVVALANLLNGNQAFNFNTASLPVGWSSGGATSFSAPCGPNPTNTPYYWASTSTGTPNITSPGFDVSCGGFINFDMVYAIQGGSAPCEGPDEMDEGVALQYSTDGGLTWITIIYYVPDGTTMTTVSTSSTSVASGATPFTTWNTFTVAIPAGALTTNTRFRWIQPSSSGSAFDNWGLDNIVINATGAPCGNQAVVNWSNGFMDTTNFTFTPLVDTSFIAYVYDTAGNFMCQSAPIFINVLDDNLSYSLVDTAYSYCPTTNPAVAVTNIQNGNPTITYNWSNGSTTSNTTLSTNGVEHGEFMYHLTITDGCGFTREDSVLLIVNKLLNIDSLNQIPTPACAIDGTLIAFVSGTSGQPLYQWTGPGASTGFINSTVWTDKPTGWYYFTVTDNLCSDNDSIFLEQLPPPSAGLTQDLTIGCAPFDVTFSNTSQDATNYFWDFGNGNTYTTSSNADQTQSYSNIASITLIAYSGPCSDTAYAAVSINTCGCMDPLAINYNPLANVDDGSCILPDPIIVVPNVFTPNNDTGNDLYQINVTYYSEIRLIITNRWGQEVYSGQGLTPGWDGKIDGKPAAEGVYFLQYEVDNIMKTKTVTGQSPVHLYR